MMVFDFVKWLLPVFPNPYATWGWDKANLHHPYSQTVCFPSFILLPSTYSASGKLFEVHIKTPGENFMKLLADPNHHLRKEH